MDRVKAILKKNTMLFALFFIMILFSILTNGTLLVPQNITNLILQNGYVVVLAIGMLLCILTGGNIDLSVGSIVALIGAIAGTLIVNMKVNVGVSIIICLLTGIIIGVCQGYFIAYLRIPAFIVTLAGMLLWRGAALMILNGLTITPFPDNYLNIFNRYLPDIFEGKFHVLTLIIGIVASVIYLMVQIINQRRLRKHGYETENKIYLIARIVLIICAIMAFAYSLAQHKGIPMVLIILAVIIFIYGYFTSNTVPGRYLYAMGGNEKAAKLSGVNTNLVLFLTYVNMAFLSAVAALICVARFNSAAPSAGQNYEMDAIAACYIGGASAYGGIGTVTGVVIGAIFMGIINNGMSIMGINTDLQKVVKGLVLLIAVTFDVISKKNSKLN